MLLSSMTVSRIKVLLGTIPNWGLIRDNFKLGRTRDYFKLRAYNGLFQIRALDNSFIYIPLCKPFKNSQKIEEIKEIPDP